MDAIDCIKTRRSRRNFLDKKVSEETIKKLIDCARNAPFGGPPRKDCQLWEFVVIRDDSIKEELTLEYDDREFIKEAPVTIAVCADKRKDPDYKNWEVTCSLAAENILLAAHSLGLGACYVTTFMHHEGHTEDREKLVKTLNLPEHIKLICLIPIGYPDSDEDIEPKELRDIEEMLHYNKW
ncbi:MAG: nitroreductase family protein [Candidatus Paceibacterota bacterium]